MSPAGTARPPGLFPQCTNPFCLFLLWGLWCARALQQDWRELGRDAAGDAGFGYSAHTGLVGYSGTPLENWLPKPWYFQSLQYSSNIRSELKALVEGLQYYTLPVFCFCIIIQVMTLCKRVHRETEILGRKMLYFLNQLEKEVMRSQDSAPFSLPFQLKATKSLDQLLAAHLYRHPPKAALTLLINRSLSLLSRKYYWYFLFLC